MPVLRSTDDDVFGYDLIGFFTGSFKQLNEIYGGG